MSNLSQNPSQNKRPLVVGDIAYDRDEKWGYTLYLNEGNDLVPYLVLTDSYGGMEGQALLFRKDLLDELSVYSIESSYYGSSQIDSFLNHDFFNSLPEILRNEILETSIEITSESSIWHAGRDLEHIYRHVFLLSATEAGYISEMYVPLIEGYKLAYFEIENSEDRRSVYWKGDNSACWWLRTANTRNARAWVCSRSGFGVHQINLERGVRPAFCIDANMVIEESENDGIKIYTLAIFS